MIFNSIYFCLFIGFMLFFFVCVLVPGDRIYACVAWEIILPKYFLILLLNTKKNVCGKVWFFHPKINIFGFSIYFGFDHKLWYLHTYYSCSCIKILYLFRGLIKHWDNVVIKFKLILLWIRRICVYVPDIIGKHSDFDMQAYGISTIVDRFVLHDTEYYYSIIMYLKKPVCLSWGIIWI